MKMGVSSIIKFVGNVNRINEYREADWTAEQIQVAFAAQGLKLKVMADDFPLMANQAELCRKAMPKAAVRADISAIDSASAAVGAG